VAITSAIALVHLPFVERERYGDPYPAGLAVGHVDVTGDASGGNITANFTSQAGFLYRLELLHALVFQNSSTAMQYITSHIWLTEASGQGAAAFDLRWFTAVSNRTTPPITLTVHTPQGPDRDMLVRLPLGHINGGAAQTIVNIQVDNQNTIVHDFNVLMSYWRKEALHRPGFWTAFWAAPVAPITP